MAKKESPAERAFLRTLFIRGLWFYLSQYNFGVVEGEDGVRRSGGQQNAIAFIQVLTLIVDFKFDSTLNHIYKHIIFDRVSSQHRSVGKSQKGHRAIVG